MNEELQLTLCGRCSNLMRERNFVRVVYRDTTSKIDCDICKRHTYGATYVITPKRRNEDGT